MSTFDINLSAPNTLRTEALNMTIKFERTSNTTGRISWTIPSSAAGCLANDQAYCGIIVTIDTTPASSSKIPTNEKIYNSDPTADNNLFAGDTIGTSKVIGAFYHDRNTTFMDVSGLTANTPYFVSGFPVDCEYRYYIEGIHAYSLDYKNDGTKGTNGTQVVLLNTALANPGVQPTDYTGLMSGINYQFQIQLGIVPKPRTPTDPAYCQPVPSVYTIQVDGASSTTYSDFVDELNRKLALIGNVPQGNTPPNTGMLYWDSTTSKLYRWDGYQTQELVVIVQTTDPSVVTSGAYWYNSTTKILNQWNGTSWIIVSYVTSVFDPINPTADTSYWYNGTISYVWNGTTWCEVPVTYIGDVDPSTVVATLGGAFWFDGTTLYKWDNEFEMWATQDYIKSSEDPNNLPNNALWFNTTNNTLQSWNYPSPGWNVHSNVYIGEQEPTTPAPGKFWWNSTTQTLKSWDWTTSTWITLSVIIQEVDPTVLTSCAVWWDTIDDSIHVWDINNLVWKTVNNFYIQTRDPALPPIIPEGSSWYNLSTGILYVWRINCFVPVNFIYSATDPTLSPVGTVWYNPSTLAWKKLNSSNVWVVVSPILSTTDPANLDIGTYWFDLSNQTLQMWNGVGWVTVLFTTSIPRPPINSPWFNSITNVLMVWNGTTWVVGTPKATVEMDCNGNLLFTDTTLGSLSFVSLTDITLFNSLLVPYTFHSPTPGTDGVSGQPSYNELGIGTDGSPDERLLLMNEIRYQFGYPVVDVELTNEQLDFAITAALNVLRQRSGLAYKRGFFFLTITPETQRYILSNKVGGFNKIVDIMGIYRLTSSFLSSAHGAGVYGQIVLQHLYNMGTFDILSYHIMAEYTKTLEMMFAGRLTFTWNELTRELWIHHRFPMTEPLVAVEASIELSEQEIIANRYARPWIRRYSTAVAMLMLAQIRGKYGNLPGASGGITLNASELKATAKEEMDLCLSEIDDFVANNPENFGAATTFIFG